MAVHVFACLCGNWVNLNEDPHCKMGTNYASPSIWWEESAKLWSPFTRKEENSMYELDYINIHYKGRDYRISPTFLQIVSS